MKTAARILATLAVFAVLLAASLYAGARLTVESAGVDVRLASGEAAAFEALRAAVEDMSFTGSVYRDIDWTRPEDYQFLTYILRLRNRGPLPAEWITLTVEASDADVAGYSESQGKSLGAFQQGVISQSMLSQKETDTRRTVRIRYYVLGMPFDLALTVP